MIAWALNWLWHGLALVLMTSLLFRLLPTLNATVRHGMWWCTLAAVGATGFWGATGADGGARTPAITFSSAPEELIFAALGLWAVVTVLALIRVVVGLRMLGIVRADCRPLSVDIEATLPRWLEARTQGRRARLVSCDAVPGATVIGLFRPCIALPDELIEALTADELDQVVLHEHAHVLRYDDWLRLCQALLQAVLWIHPAVALAGRGVSREREMACDEWVVALTGSPKNYARCLTRAVQVTRGIRERSVLGPALFGRHRDLHHRVARLLAMRGQGKPRRPGWVACAGACAWLTIAACLASVPLAAEVVRLALPAVEAVEAVLPAAVRRPDGPLEDRPVPEKTARIRYERAPTALVEPAAIALVPSDAPVALAEAATRPDVSTIASRILGGHYGQIAPDPVPEGSLNAWQLAGTAGSSIGSAARKTGVGIADGFARAGVSLTRLRFPVMQRGSFK